jgi:hypothetical protein
MNNELNLDFLDSRPQIFNSNIQTIFKPLESTTIASLCPYNTSWVASSNH